MTSLRDITLLAWREIWSTLRHPTFWIAVLGMPLLMIVVMVLLLNSELATPAERKAPIVLVDGSGVLGEAAVAHLNTRGLEAETQNAPVETLRDQVERGEIAMLIHLDETTLTAGTGRVASITPPSSELRAILSDAITLASVAHRPSAVSPTIVHTPVQRTTQIEVDAATLQLWTLGSALALLLPVSLLGTVISQGMRRDRRSGFSTLLVCSTRAENVLAGQVIGGVVLAVLQSLVYGGIYVVLVASTLPGSGSGTNALGLTPSIQDENANALVESLIALMGTQGGAVHLNDLLLALGLYILLGLIGTLNYVAWGMAGAVGGSSNEGETDATRNARLFFVMGLVYPAMIVGYFALLDPGGTLASWSQCVPVLFAIVVWGKYLHGVLDAWAFLAVAVHLLWSLWLVHLVARTYVTSETLWEFGRRRIARARRG